MLSAERGAAQNTLLAYRRDLEDYGAFLSRRGIAAERAGSTDIRDYLAELDGCGRIARDGEPAAIGDPAISQIPARRGDKPRQSGCDHRKSEAASLLAEKPLGRGCLAPTGDGGTQGGNVPRAGTVSGRKRLHCLLELIYGTGLRVSELVGLTVQAASADPTFPHHQGQGRPRKTGADEPAAWRDRRPAISSYCARRRERRASGSFPRTASRVI